jgi:anti-anti-sigma factor
LSLTKEKQPPFAILGEGHPITNRYVTSALAYGQTWISSGDFDNIQFPIITRGQVMEELKVTLEHLESTVVLRAVGPVDSTTAASLQEPLLRAVESSSGAVQLDLAQVSYLSSAGMRVFLLAAKALQKRGERLRLLNVPQQIHSLLNLAGFTSFIDVNS